MRNEVLSAAARKNIFLSPDALDVILSNSKPLDFVNTVLGALSNNSGFVTRDDVINCISGESTIFESPKTIAPKNKRQTDISIIPGTDVTGESTCEGKIDDFAGYFKNRFYSLKKIIEKRRDFGSAMSIDKAVKLDRESKIIGMVYERKDTKNGHVMLKVEDETATCSVLIMKDSPLINEIFVNDEVIGISGKATNRGDLYIANEIFRPDVPASNKWIPSDSVSSVAFLSDIHVGSYMFMKPQWDRMISWLKQNARDTDLDYLVLPGDVVDGIGIFPGQDEELSISSIYKQYDVLADYLKEVPDHIKIVLQPGNHDSVRLAEPQPALGEAFTKNFDSNIMMVSNPINLKIEGRTVLSYHGKSIDDWVAGVRQLSYDDPVRVMEEMVKRRHVAPMYGQKTALAPEKKDYLVMENLPDIFISGHVHGAGFKEYRGVKMVNASAWQNQTDYQRMHNFNPEPAIMPIVHLGTGRVTLKNFMK